MSLAKIDDVRLYADRVYDTIHQAIMSGDLPAGSRLRVRDLAAEVGTSVMPVREAIRRLEEAGLAEREPHRGAVVRALTREELVHIYDVRRHLESLAARLGAEQISAEDCDRMDALYADMRRALAERRPIDYLDRDEELLAVLYEASGNPVLVNLIRTLWQRCRPYKVVGAQAVVDADDDTLWRFQRELIDAARNGDGVAAEAVSSASLLDATRRIRRELVEQ